MSTAVLPRGRVAPGGEDAASAALTVATATATAAATAWAVVASGWNPGLLVVVLVAAVAAVEAGLVASGHARAPVAWLVCPLLALLVVVPLTLPEMSADGGPATLTHVAGRYLVALAVGAVSNDSFRFIVGCAGGMWLLGWWTGWVAVRERLPVLAALPAWVVLGANAVNTHHAGDAAVPTTVALLCSLLLVARVSLTALRRSWQRERIVATGSVGRRQAATAALAAVGVLAVGVALPPGTTVDNSGRLFHFTVDDLAGIGSSRSGGAGGVPGLAPGAIAFSTVTVPGGALVDDPHPVLTFTTDVDGVVYLRGVDDPVFEAGNWSPAPGLTRAVSPAGPLARDRAAADGGVVGPQQPVTVKIVPAGGSTGALDRALFGGEPDGVDQRAVSAGLEGPGGLLTVEQVTPVGVTASTLTTTALVPAATADQLRAAGSDPSWLAPAGYTDLGRNSTDAQIADLRALAREWTAGTTRRYDAVRAIETRLRSAPFTYTLTPPIAPAGEWPVHYFLMSSHRGYCQYYASAMGTLLRVLGIPTRLVNGYGSGTVDDSQSRPRSVVHRITTSDAHTWVEVYFAGAGWIPFEPTPSTQYGAYDPITRPLPAGATPVPTAAPSGSAATPTPRATPTPDPGAAGAGTGTAPTVPPTLVAAVVALLAVALLVALLLAVLARPPGMAGLWWRLALAGRLLGVRRAPSDTDLGWVARVTAALPPDTVTLLHPRGGGLGGRRVHDRAATALALLGALSGRARFGPAGLSPAQALQWRRTWRRLLRLLPLLTWRHLLVRLAGSTQTRLAAGR